MWNSREPPGENSSGDGNGDDKTVAKTAGFVVFSGIAMSIIKALHPFDKPDLKVNPNPSANPLTESTQPQAQVFQQCRPSLTPPPEPITKKPNDSHVDNVEESSPKVIEIVRGDTHWGLSRKFGVSIEAIKEAYGLTA